MSFSTLSEQCAGYEHFLLGHVDPDHDACPVKQHVNGVLGGWDCSCECHRKQSGASTVEASSTGDNAPQTPDRGSYRKGSAGL